MTVKNLVCLLPLFEVFSPGSQILAQAGIPLALTQSVDEPTMNAFIIDESSYKVAERHKIQLQSLNPLVIPGHTYYQRDLRSILQGHSDSSKEQYNPYVGFYKRKQVFFEEDVQVGDLLLNIFEHSNMSPFAIVDRVLAIHSPLKRLLFGAYRLDSVVGEKRPYKSDKCVNRTFNVNKNKTVVCQTYKLEPVDLEDVFESTYPTNRVRAGSPVPPTNALMFA